jgi:hypothetical protein
MQKKRLSQPRVTPQVFGQPLFINYSTETKKE